MENLVEGMTVELKTTGQHGHIKDVDFWFDAESGECLRSCLVNFYSFCDWFAEDSLEETVF